MQAGLGVEIESGRRAPKVAEDHLGELRAAECRHFHRGSFRGVFGNIRDRFGLNFNRVIPHRLGLEGNFEVRIGLFAPGNRPKQQNRISSLLELRRNGPGHIVQNAHDAQHRRGIDGFAAGFVIERHVAAGDGRAEGSAGFGDAVDGRRKLSHDLRLLGIAEIEAVGGGHRGCAGHGNLARTLGDGVHRAQLGIEISPAAVAVKRHGQADLPDWSFRSVRLSRSLDAHHAGLAAGADHGVGLDHGVVLLVDPALGADVRADQQLFQVGGKIAVPGELGKEFFGGLERDGGLPCAYGAMVERGVVSQRFVGNVGDQFAVVADAEARPRLDGADDDGVETPLLKDLEDFVFAAPGGHQQHPLLALGEHDFIGGHAGFALRDEVQLDVESDAAAGAHLAGGTGQPGGAHVLDADDGAGLHGFKAGFEEELFHERVANLDVGPLGLRAFAELFAGHGGAVDAVAAGLGADVDDWVARAAGFGVEDFVLADQAEGEGVDQRVAAVAGLELGFAAQIGHAETVAVGGDAADHAFDNGVVAGDEPPLFRVLVEFFADRPEAERVHDSQRPRAHGEDVAQDAAHACGRALKRLDVAGVVVALDLEGAGPAFAYVDDAG